MAFDTFNKKFGIPQKEPITGPTYFSDFKSRYGIDYSNPVLPTQAPAEIISPAIKPKQDTWSRITDWFSKPAVAPEKPFVMPKSTFDASKPIPRNLIDFGTPSTSIAKSTQMIPDETTPSTANLLKNLFIDMPIAIVNSELHPDAEQLNFESQLGKDKTPFEKAVALPLYQATTRFFRPILQPFADDIALAVAGNSKTVQKKFGISFEDITYMPAWDKTSAQVVGDTAQAVFAAYSPSIFGKTAGAYSSYGIKQAFTKGVTNGAQAGLFFGTAQALSSGSKDPMDIAKIVLANTIGGSILGGLTSSAVPIGREGFAKLTKNIFTSYKLPRNVYIDAAKVKDIFQTGKIISPEEMDLVKALGLDGPGYRDAIKNGVSIEISSEKFITIMDKPYWAKIKGMFGIKPFSKTVYPISHPKIAFKQLSEPQLQAQKEMLVKQQAALETKLATETKTAVSTTDPTITKEPISQPAAPRTLVSMPNGANTLTKATQALRASGFSQSEISQILSDTPVKEITGTQQIYAEDLNTSVKIFEDQRLRPSDPVATSNEIANVSKQIEEVNVQLAEAAANEQHLADTLSNETIKKLTLKPSQALTPEQQVAEVEKLFNSSEMKKALVSKADIKALFTYNQDFQNNPVLIVDDSKYLTFTGANSKFKISAKALGLQEENLSVGDEITVDPTTLKGKVQQMRVYEGDNVYASIPIRGAGGKFQGSVSEKDVVYRAQEKGTTGKFYTQNKADAEAYAKLNKNSEIIERDISKLNLKKVTSREMLDQSENPETMKKYDGLIFTHPVTGTTDYVLFDKPKSFASEPAKYDPDMLPKLTGKLGGIKNIKPIEMPELVRLARELMGNFPTVVKRVGKASGMFYAEADGRIKLIASLFDKEGNSVSQAARVLAHEIGHLIDYLPEGTMKRGNLVGRLNTLRGFQQEFFPEGGVTRSNKDLRKELLDITRYWHPYDPKTVSASYKAYRESSVELYADFISVLFNDPGVVEKMAPAAYNTFFKQLDKKPDVKEAFFSLQELLNGNSEDIFKARQDDILKGFARAEAIQADFRAKKKLAIGSYWDKLRQQVDDVNYPTTKKQHEAEAAGKVFPEGENPKFLLEEQSMVDNENFLLVSKLDKDITKPIKDAGMSEYEIGQYLMLNRIKTERAEIANPFGFNPKNAQDQLDYMKQQLGPEKFALLEDKVKRFHEIVFPAVQEAVRVGSYSAELFNEKILPNKDNYAAFQVVDYMQDHMPAGIKAQVGTLKEISNPYISTILKTVSLNRLNAYQRAKNSVLGMLKKDFHTEISETRRITTDGKLSVFRPADDKGSIEVLENGKMQSYDVDPYIAESFKVNKVGDLNIVVSLMEKFNNELFKPLVTTFNLGFAAGTNPIRDFIRNYKLIPNATIVKQFGAYARSIADAVKYAEGNLTPFTESLVESKAISFPTKEYAYAEIDTEYMAILERFGLIQKSESLSNPVVENLRKIILTPISKVFEAIRFVANTFEIISKISGARMRMAGGESGKELAYNLRNYTGTPNFRKRGTSTKNTNSIFVFSNIMKEGLKTDLQIATNPNTRSGYWWKTIKTDLFYKFLQRAALAGLFGVGIKEFYEKISEYDMSNYINIPLGYYNDKAMYFRVPHDQTGRLVSSIFWKLSDLALTGDAKNVQDIFAIGAGQFPSFTPIIELASSWGQYLSGKNPYDAFRGRNRIDDTTWQAGGGAALKKMVEYTFNTVGLTKFATYDDVNRTTLETFMQVAPWFSSMIKISDYGVTEKLKAVADKQKTIEARQTLRTNEAIANNIKSALTDKDNMSVYAKKTIIEAIGTVPVNSTALQLEDYVANAKKVLNKFTKAVITGNMTDPIEKAIAGATSNAQKAAMLKYIQEDKSTDEFKELLIQMLEDKTITADVIKKMAI